MKKILKVCSFFIFINAIIFIQPGKAVAQPGSVSFQVFYDDLTPYGNWFQSPDYGYVWRPSMNSGFTPYSTNGYWILTDAGWTWVSDYSWGWAPFHYGRWYNDPFYGYVWVPGYEWGPGWVSWRRSNDYYGWAPIGPGVDISVAYGSGYNLPYNQWNFVRCRDFGRRDLHNYYINRTSNVTIINKTTVINNVRIDNSRNTKYNIGPDRAEVQKYSGKPVNQVAIVDAQTPAQHVNKNNVQLYRPLVADNTASSTKPVPAKVTPLNEVKKAPPASLVKGQNIPLHTGGIKQPVKQQSINSANIQHDEPNTNAQPGTVKNPSAGQPLIPRIRQHTPQRPVKNPDENSTQPGQPKTMNQPIRDNQVRPGNVQPERRMHEPIQQPKAGNIDQQPVRQERPAPVREEPIRQAPAVQRASPPPTRQATQGQAPAMSRPSPAPSPRHGN